MRWDNALGRLRVVADAALEKASDIAALAWERVSDFKDTVYYQGRDIVKAAKDEGDREFLHIERRGDLTADEKITKIIEVSASICKRTLELPLQIPPSIVICVHVYMATRMAAVRGMALGRPGAVALLYRCSRIIGKDLIWQQFTGTLRKLLPFAGSPAVARGAFVYTYGIGRVVDAYLACSGQQDSFTDQVILSVWKTGKVEGERAFDSGQT